MTDKMLAVFLILLAGGYAGARAEDDCPASPSELAPAPALTEIHGAQRGTEEEIEPVLDRWLPVVGCLEAAEASDEDWLHVAVDLGRLLVHLDRRDEARGVFGSARDLDPDGAWGRQAALQLYALDNLRPGMPGPPFEGRTLSGETLSSDTLVGQVVVLDFWATWCPPCVADLERLKDLLSRFGDDGLAVVGVALDETREPVERMAAEKGVSWPQLWDGKGADGEIPRLFAVEGPATF